MPEQSQRTFGVADPIQTQTESTGRNIVVTIGIDAYPSMPLQNAVNDARDVCNLFVNLGFETTDKILPGSGEQRLLDKYATGEAITTLIHDQLPTVLQENDNLVIFFAGHGGTVTRKVCGREVDIGYLLPVDAKLGQRSSYLKLDSLLQEISLLPARHILVILDACESGMALSRAITVFPSVIRSEKPQAGRLSRRIIASALRDQKAADFGPKRGHSAFTGALLQGLDWGSADLNQDDKVTSSELGLYLQQQMEQATSYSQTVVFGAFELDDQGEMELNLMGGTFHGVKMETQAVLRQGETNEFRKKVSELVVKESDNPWTLYYLYRRALLDGEVQEAINLVEGLRQMNLRRGAIPLSTDDLITLSEQVDYFQKILAIPESDDLQLNLSLYSIEGEMQRARSYLSPCEYGQQMTDDQFIGDQKGYELSPGCLAMFKVMNNTSMPLHIYFLTIRPDGRLVIGALLEDPHLALNGLEPGQTAEGSPFKVVNIGLTETRIFCSYEQIPALLLPPTTASQGFSRPEGFVELNDVHRKTIWYLVRQPDFVQ